MLLNQIGKYITRDIAVHAENVLPAVDDFNKAEFLALLESRKPEMTTAQLSRIKKVIKQLSIKYNFSTDS